MQKSPATALNLVTSHDLWCSPKTAQISICWKHKMDVFLITKQENKNLIVIIFHSYDSVKFLLLKFLIITTCLKSLLSKYLNSLVFPFCKLVVQFLGSIFSHFNIMFQHSHSLVWNLFCHLGGLTDRKQWEGSKDNKLWVWGKIWRRVPLCWVLEGDEANAAPEDVEEFPEDPA